MKPKNKINNYDQRIIKALSLKYGVTKHFIRASIRKDRVSITSDRILKDYRELTAANERKINQYLEK